MSTHTPGPWMVDVVKNGGDWEWNIRTVAPHNPAGTVGKHVATVNKYLYDPAANSAVIAAAPDILALVTRALTYQTKAFDDDTEISGADLLEWFAAWRVNAKAIIQKAAST